MAGSRLHNIRKQLSSDDAFKCLVAFLYSLVVGIFLAFIQVLVHLRMPSNETISAKGSVAPLPDILLDWLPYAEWGLRVSEICISLLLGLLLVVVVIHKHWLVLLRRLFTIFGSLYFIRAICLISTSPTPASVIVMETCSKYPLNTKMDYLKRAWNIFSTFGMQLRGGRTCGDYIFSGHTCIMTLCILFILTYLPKLSRHKFVFLTIILGGIECSGILFILLSREHYTIDIIIALILTYALFTEYHWITKYLQLTIQMDQLLCKDSLPQRKYWRIRITSPIVFYMERNGTTLHEEFSSITEIKNHYFKA